MDTAYRALGEAQVEFVDGTLAGTSTMTSTTGQFSFSGTFNGTIILRARKAGFFDVQKTVNTSAFHPPEASVQFSLLSLEAPVNVAGDYTMTVVASPACTSIPEALRNRTYDTSITASSSAAFPPNTHFDAIVSGASLITTFDGLSNRLGIGVAGRDVVINIDFDGPLIVEQIDPRTFLSIDGTAVATVGTSPAKINAVLDGFLQYCQLASDGDYRFCFDPARVVRRSNCVATDHRLILQHR